MTALLTLADCLEALTGQRLKIAERIITEADIDSRQVIPGALFVALPGERTDGHDFIEEAFKHGAGLAIVQKDVKEKFQQIDLRSSISANELIIPQGKFCILTNDSLKALQTIARFWRRKLDIRIVGITGSVGKSTTKELTAEILSSKYRTFKNMGNLNNEIGLPLSLLRLTGGYQYAVLEMGFYVPGEISFLCDLALPQIGIVTNVGMVHAERAGSKEEIARGKSELVQALPATPEGVAILNYDDPLVRDMREVTKARVIMYGLDPAATLWADRIESHGLQGIEFNLHFDHDTFHIHVPLLGQHSVHTILRASAAGIAADLSWSEIIAGLQETHSQLRLVAVHSRNGALILDDTYNASPESTLAALSLLGELEGHKIAVLGDMLELGQYEKLGHEKVGYRVAEVADELITVGKLGKIIGQAAIQAGLPKKSVSWFAGVEQVIDMLDTKLTEKDVALIKGSHGLRMDRIVTALEIES
jgi:UDP-N-acetylmuramoyl-tripeptide--D-alanyl-D-alanine ligase